MRMPSYEELKAKTDVMKTLEEHQYELVCMKKEKVQLELRKLKVASDGTKAFNKLKNLSNLVMVISILLILDSWLGTEQNILSQLFSIWGLKDIDVSSNQLRPILQVTLYVLYIVFILSVVYAGFQNNNPSFQYWPEPDTNAIEFRPMPEVYAKLLDKIFRGGSSIIWTFFNVLFFLLDFYASVILGAVAINLS